MPRCAQRNAAVGPLNLARRCSMRLSFQGRSPSLELDGIIRTPFRPRHPRGRRLADGARKAIGTSGDYSALATRSADFTQVLV